MKISAKQQHACLATEELTNISALSTARSAPGLFKNETFHYNLGKLLWLTTYSGPEPVDCFTGDNQIEEGKND